MRRRDLLKLAGAPVALAALPSVAHNAESARTYSLELANGVFRLTLDLIGPLRCRLEHKPSGIILAEGGYSYSFTPPPLQVVSHEHATVVLVGQTDWGLEIEHRFTLDSRGHVFEEQVALTNATSAPFDLSELRCGFVLPVGGRESVVEALDLGQQFAAIPFLREPTGTRQQYSRFNLTQILNGRFHSQLWERFTGIPVPLEPTTRFASEAWFWEHPGLGFLVSKYSQSGMEWAVLDHVPLAHGGIGLRWGGCGTFRGNPQNAAWLAPGRTHRFGVTTVTPVSGGIERACYAFRAEMEARGHGCPADFDPPVHWNELYDNKLMFQPADGYDDPEMRKKFYSLDDMKAAAQKAKAFGCEALYLDPGWDTNFGSKIWDEARLGPFRSFTDMLWKEFRLKCSLHVPLSGWCNPTSYSSECNRVDYLGKPARWDESFDRKLFYPPLCGTSRQFIDETAGRLKALARDGAVFFMFDGTMYHGECWSREHGHPVPSRMEDHVAGTLSLGRRLREEFPGLMIEMHDPVVGGVQGRYTPVYYGHVDCERGHRPFQQASFDSVWAFELMWSPMEDLLSGRAIALYYYNLAYSLPLYIHVDLRTDNNHALVFWWNASTCRHLGIGGAHTDAAVVDAHKQAMKTYRRLKSYYARGAFYGIDELTHVHASPDWKSAVLNCFNIDEEPVERQIRFDPAEFGLQRQKRFQFLGARFSRAGRIYLGTVNIPGKGHVLIEVT